MTTTKLRFVDTTAESNQLTQAEKKRRLRTYMKDRRGENENRDVKERLLNERFQQSLLSETKIGERLKIFIYLSFSSEASTDKLIEELLEKGHEVYCPRIENGEMQAVRYGEDFTLSSYGIREPIGEIFNGSPDIIVLPLLAADEKGRRLGYGGGYYDRYLQCHPAAKRVGYCFDFQIVASVPTETWDEGLDVLITDKRTLFFERNRP